MPATAEFHRVTGGNTEGMRLIPAGEFLMGNERDYGFAVDGEGPVHAVKLSAFWMDATCVTNEQFNAFVNETSYKTEAEKFGWSFVFEGNLEPAQRDRPGGLTVQGSEWWRRVDDATWRNPSPMLP